MTPDLLQQIVNRLTKAEQELARLRSRDYGPARLASQRDVEITSIQPHQILRYQDSTGLWVNRYTALFTGPVLTETVASGAIDVAGSTTGTNFAVLGEGGVADELDTITSDQAGHIIVVRRDPTTTITLKHGTGNLLLGGSDIVLDSDEKAVWLLYTGAGDFVAVGGFGSGATGAPGLHAASHQHGGTDEVATVTPGANAIPKAEGGGTLAAGWIPDLSGTYQPLDSDLTTIAGLTPVDNGVMIGSAAPAWSVESGATLRASLGLAIGTDVQPYDADLTAIAALTQVADNFIISNGSSWIQAGPITTRAALGLGTMALEAASAYLLLAGLAGGQTANGGTAAGEDLTLVSTAHATKGSIFFGAAGLSAYDEVNNRLGINVAVPLARLHVGGGANNDIALDSGGAYRIADSGGVYRSMLNMNADDIARFGVQGGGVVSTYIHSGSATPSIAAVPSLRVGFNGVTAPASLGHFYQNDSAVDASTGITIEQDGAGDANLHFLLSSVQRWVIGIDHSRSGDPFAWSPIQDHANAVMLLSTTGALTISGALTVGVSNLPAGSLTPIFGGHDGTSGWFFWTVNITSGTAVTVIANGTGDVIDRMLWQGVIEPSSGASVPLAGNLTPGNNSNLFDDGGTNTVQIQLNANGAVTIQRTAGTLTYKVTIRILWQ